MAKKVTFKATSFNFGANKRGKTSKAKGKSGGKTGGGWRSYTKGR